MTEVIVKQDETNPVPAEVLAEEIQAISAGIRRLLEGRLNERALLLLIQHASPAVKAGRYRSGSPVTVKQVKAVLQGLESLEREYLKPKKVVKK